MVSIHESLSFILNSWKLLLDIILITSETICFSRAASCGPRAGPDLGTMFSLSCRFAGLEAVSAFSEPFRTVSKIRVHHFRLQQVLPHLFGRRNWYCKENGLQDVRNSFQNTFGVNARRYQAKAQAVSNDGNQKNTAPSCRFIEATVGSNIWIIDQMTTITEIILIDHWLL